MKKRKKKRPKGNAELYRSLMGQAGTVKLNKQGQALRQNLRVKFLHQEDKVDGAIAVERERNPSGDEETWMRAAIARWERENQ